MVNISTVNVLAEQNVFLKGHGVSIGNSLTRYITHGPANLLSTQEHLSSSVASVAFVVGI